jgi:hypothetical protein
VTGASEGHKAIHVSVFHVETSTANACLLFYSRMPLAETRWGQRGVPRAAEKQQRVNS